MQREAQTAVEAGYEVDVVAMHREGEQKREVVDDVRVIRLPLSHRRRAGVVGVLAEYIGFTLLATTTVARRRYDVVQVHNPPDFLLLAGIVPKLLGARLILDVHDLSPDMFAMRFGERGAARFADRALRVIERLATSAADHVVTVHDPYRLELISRGVAPRKVSVVMNSLDERLLPPGTREADLSAFRVVYHGTVTPPYGVALVVEAVARIASELRDVRLDILGEGDSVGETRRRMDDLGIADRVFVSGRYLPQRDVLEQVQSASVGVVPNLPTRLNRFALSTKLFEYVALGVPVVSADLPTIRAHFSDDELLFFRAGDPDALGEALLAVARDPEAAAARAEAATRRYEQYRWPVQARRYATILNSPASTGRNGRP